MLNCKGKIISLESPKVMGILNVTDNSFFDGGRYISLKDQLKHCEKMLNEGAAIIDIGAVSTKPGSKPVGFKTEWDRLKTSLKEIRKIFPETIISVDTYRSEIARNAIEEGADIINDISAGTFDEKMINTISHYQVPYIIMHIQGSPENMQQSPSYDNVVKDILTFLSERIQKMKVLGVNDIIIDPGIGFGKTLAHNFEILKNLDVFVQTNYPVLIGVSRKSLINKVLGTNPDNALNGTTVLNTLALYKGAKILRVHDVKEAVQVVKLLKQF